MAILIRNLAGFRPNDPFGLYRAPKVDTDPKVSQTPDVDVANAADSASAPERVARQDRSKPQPAVARLDDVPSATPAVAKDERIAAEPVSIEAPEPEEPKPMGSVPTKEQMADYTRRAAIERGIDPDVAVRVAQSEGLNPVTRFEDGLQSTYERNGVREPSFGPFQLLVGEDAPGFGPGLGDEFIAATGLDPRDPSTAFAQIDFALDQAAQNGWGAWYGAKRVGIGKRDGLDGARAIGRTPQQPREVARVADNPVPLEIAEPNGDPDGPRGNPDGQGLAALVPAPEAAPAQNSSGEYGLSFVHAGQDKIDKDFEQVLTATANTLGRDLVIQSGYRSPQHPVEARKIARGGQPGEHAKGTAVDINMTGMSAGERQELIYTLRSMGVNRFIAYSGFDSLHVDMKDQTGKGTPWFMFDRSARNMGRAPEWYREAAAKAADITPDPSLARADVNRSILKAGQDFVPQDPMGLYGDENPLNQLVSQAHAPKRVPIPADRPVRTSELQPTGQDGPFVTIEDGQGGYVNVPTMFQGPNGQPIDLSGNEDALRAMTPTLEQAGMLERFETAESAQAALAPAPETNAPEEGSFLPEVGKGIAGGAVGVTGTALKGLAAPIARDPAEERAAAAAIADFSRLAAMEPGEYGQWQQQIVRDLGNVKSINVLAHARLVRDGKITPEFAAENVSLDFLSDTNLEDTKLFQAGERVQQFGEEQFAAAQDYQDTWTRKISEGLGSTIPFLLAGSTGAAGSAVIGTTLGTAASAGEAIDRAVNAGATREQVIEAARLGKFPGLTEQMPIELLFERVPLPLAGRFANAMGKVLAQAAAEGGQEAVQQTAQNLIERYVYDPDQPLMEGVAEAAAVGAAVGGTLKAGQQGISAATSRGEPATDEVQPPLEDDAGAPAPAASDGAPAYEPNAGPFSPGDAAPPLPEPSVVRDVPVAAAQEDTAAPASETEQRVTVTLEGAEPFDATVDSVEGDEVIVVDAETGEFLQVPSDAIAPLENDTPASARPVLDDDRQETEVPPLPPATEVRDVPVSAVPANQNEVATEPEAAPEAAATTQIDESPAASVTPEPVDVSLPETEQSSQQPDSQPSQDDGPPRREVKGRSMVFENQQAAQLFDLGHKLNLGRRGTLTMARIDKDLLPEREAVAEALGVPLEKVNRIAAEQYRAARMYSDRGADTVPLYGVTLPETKFDMPPVEMTPTPALSAPIDAAANEAATSPTNSLPEPSDAQKEAGNYKVGRVRLGGFDVSIENPAGSTRSGTAADGSTWSTEMKSHYGYFRGTIGRDKDHIDTFIKPGTRELADDAPIFVVDQVNEDGSFDEHKVMTGYASAGEARAAYLENYDDGWRGLGDITETTVGEFRDWARSGNTRKPFASPVPDSTVTPRVEDQTAPESGKRPRSLQAIDLVSTGDVDPFIEQIDGFTPKQIANAVAYGLEYKKTSRPHAKRVLDAAGLEQPASADMDRLAREAYRVENFAQGKGILPADGKKRIDQPWMQLHGLERKWLRYRGTLLSVTPDGEKVFGSQLRGHSKRGAGDPKPASTPDNRAAAKPDSARKAAQSSTDVFSKNTIFTSDRVQAARARLRSKMNQLNAGIDPEVLIDGVVITGAYVEAGVRNFADYAGKMIDDMGNGVRPYLLSFWEATRAFPDVDAEGMTPADVAKKMHDTLLADPEMTPDQLADSVSADRTDDTNTDSTSTDEPRQLETDGTDALAGEPAGSVRASDQDGSPRGDVDDRGEPDLFGGGRSRERGDAGARGVRDRSQRASVPDTGDADGRTDVADGRDDGGDGEQSTADRPVGAVKPAAQRPDNYSQNYSIGVDESIGVGGLKTKFKDNVAAIEVLRTLDKERRTPTRAEQRTLARWVGWGGLQSAFERPDGSIAKGWSKEATQLKDMLSDAEYGAARASTRNAHFTSPEIVNAIWSGTERLGFAGGRVLEPAAGAGNFLGLMPKGTRAASQITAIEIDPITGAIAKHLYPSADVRDGVGFQLAAPDEAQAEVDRANAQLPKLQEQISPFDKLDTLEEKRARQREVNRLLSGETKPTAATTDAEPSLPEDGAQSALSDDDIRQIEAIIRDVGGLDDIGYADTIPLPDDARGWGETGYTSAAGFYSPSADAITLALDTATPRTAYHEAFHRLQNLFLMDSERQLLTSETARLRRIVGRERDGAPDMSQKELEAEAFAIYATDKANPGSRIRKAWDRIVNVTDRVRNWLGGKGWRTIGDVFEAARRGETMRRAPKKSTDTQTSFSLPQGTRGQAVFERSMDAIRGASVDVQPALLKLVPLNYFTELKRPNMKSVDRYMRMKRQMDGYRGDKHAEANELAQLWLSFASKGAKGGKTYAKQLHALMHDATLAGIDPSKRAHPGDDSARYDTLRKRYEALPKDGQKLFRDARDAYLAQQKELDQIILDNAQKAFEIARKQALKAYDEEVARIGRSKMSDKAKEQAIKDAADKYDATDIRTTLSMKARMTRLRKAFESSRVSPPYFPLARFGRYYVLVKDQTGEVISFSKRESARVRDRLAKQLRKDFPDADVTVGVMEEMGSMREAMDPRVISQMEEIVGSAGMSSSAVVEVLDQIWQRYLQTMPDLSIRKRFIHRKGTPGFDEDALRAFSSHMFHAAHQMARLKYGPDLQELTNDITDEAKASDDPTRGVTLANEMRRRHEWVMNPTGGKVAQTMTSTAFVWFLGVTPAAAMVNLSQTPILGSAVLGGRFGMIKGQKALLAASRDSVAGRGLPSKAKLKADEVKAINVMYESGMIDRTQSHDLAGVGDTGVVYSPMRQRVMEKIAFLFHNAERWNREVTALAAYRLARDSGQQFEEAVNTAHELTYRTHFDYSNSSRPSLLQNDFAKVALVFRAHNINMLYRLFRDLHQSFKGETAPARKEARMQLAGIFGMMGLFAGTTGVLGFNMIMALADLVAGDEDDPFDMENHYRKAVIEALGPELGGIVLNGLPGHYGGVDLTNRIGMPDLWFRSPNRDLQGQDEFEYWVVQALGAVVGMGGNFFKGFSMVRDGEVVKGIEAAAPKFARDLMRAYRYNREGVTDYWGNQVVPAEEITVWDVVVQASGFTPAKVSEAWRENSSLKNADQRIRRKRGKLIAQYALAFKMDDQPQMERVLQDIEAFNAVPLHVSVPITPKTLNQSIRTRARNEQKRQGGVLIQNRGLDVGLRERVPERIY